MKRIITLFCLFSALQSFSQLNELLKIYYKFDNNTLDYSGNNYDGDPHGVTFVDDRFGNPESAVHFNGIDNFINFPNVEALKGQLPVAFSFFIKYDSTDYHAQALMNTSFENNHCTGVWLNSQASTGRYAVNFGDGSYFYTPESRRTYISNTVIEPEVWHHIAIVVLSATQMYFFVDGIEAGGTYAGEGGDLVYSLTPGCLGRHDRDLTAPADYFMGSLDDFTYWTNRTLSQEEVIALRDGTAEALSVSTPVAAERFSVYPNPAQDRIYISSENAYDNVVISNSLGQQVYTSKAMPSIDVSNFAPGVYFLTTDGAAPQTKKIIIK